jgi:beta-xylosidase
MRHYSEVSAHTFGKISFSTMAIWLISSTFSLESQTAKQTAIPEKQYVSKVWKADNEDGTYKNPIINADYSDPDAIRVGNDFYMTSSSFTCAPALPVLHSKDLVNWTLIGHALKKQIPLDVFDRPQQGKGVWAPAIRYHNNEFYIYYPDPDYGIYMVKTKDPAGDWEDPVLVIGGRGLIDPCPFWDEDGKAYLVNAWASSRSGINSIITVFRMNAEGTKVIDDGRIVYDQRERNPTMEGPKVYKRNGFYYISAPAGGVPKGWQIILRSKSIYGPFEEKKVIDQGTTEINGPHQGAYVETQTGQTWFIHFQDKAAYGRVVHLQPVRWVNDWPVTGIDKDGDGKGEPVTTFMKPEVNGIYPVSTPVESDEFDSDKLGLQWQWNANPKVTWLSLIRGTGFLRLYSAPIPESYSNLWDLPNLLAQKLPAESFTATTKVTAGNGKSGLVIMGRSYSYICIEKDSNNIVISEVICEGADKKSKESIIQSVTINSSTVYFRVKVSSPDALCTFSYSINGTDYQPLGKNFKAVAGGWIGAKAGLFCMPRNNRTGYADFDWFRVE